MKLRSVLLSFVGGFVDTATFVHVPGLFVAHVTGNFIVFSADLAHGLDLEKGLKLLVFPIFLGATLLGGLIHGHHLIASPDRRYRRLMLLEFLLIAGLAVSALVLQMRAGSEHLGHADLILGLSLAVAMGVQNSMQPFTGGPMTTMMTGNVTHVVSVLGRRLNRLFRRHATREPPIPPSLPGMMVVTFLVGCASSAFLVSSFGLAALLVPATFVLAALLVDLVVEGRGLPTSQDPTGRPQP